MKLGKVRVSRPNYDKGWRCPSWAGPGWSSYADRWECDASLAQSWERAGARQRWVVHRCPGCGTYVLPAVINVLDPTHWWDLVTDQWPRKLRYWWWNGTHGYGWDGPFWKQRRLAHYHLRQLRRRWQR